MIDVAKKYPSKLLLFGEHIVIKGADALAVPFPTFYGQWQYSTNPTAKNKQQALPEFAQYLAKVLPKIIHHQAFQQALNDGLFFQSNIPTGYGAGSSGALVAAIFDSFGDKTQLNEPYQLKDILAKMECFFHGSSSGTDPLICYLQAAILLTKNGNWTPIKLLHPLKTAPLTLFLLDTHKSRKTAPFVQTFLQNWETKTYQKIVSENIFPLNNTAIENFIAGDWTNLTKNFSQLSFWQWEYFKAMIPENLKYWWLFGLKSEIYHLKLCGAGGGGFMLGMTKDLKETEKVLSDWKLTVIDW